MNSYRIISVALLLIMSISLTAQRGDRAERIESLKVGYFTEKLDLSSAEAEKFWPLYNEMNDQIKELRRSFRVQNGDASDLTEAEAESYINSRLEKESEALAVKKDYYQKMMGVISALKVMKLTKVEADFKKELLKEVQKRRRQRDNR